MRAPEAKLRCPELQCIHVETIGGSGDGATAAERSQVSRCCLEDGFAASQAVGSLFVGSITTTTTLHRGLLQFAVEQRAHIALWKRPTAEG